MKRPAYPLTLLALMIVGTALAGPPEFIPNHQKYRDSSEKPATGRSGSATLNAQALLGMDQVTVLQVSTGSFDSSAPGNIEKLQVKLSSGTAHRTINFNNLNEGGYITRSFDGLAQDDSIQVQANIKGIDPKRTDVVTVQTKVKYAADLQVFSIIAPPDAEPHVPVVIDAVVRELNGKLGATADLVLSVDDQEVDRARGTWVDAGGTATHRFSHVFDTGGVKQLRVWLDRIDPGDYDPSNNSATDQIEIRKLFSTFTASATEVEETFSSHYSATWKEETVNQTGWISQAMLKGRFGPLNFATARVTVQHFSGLLSTEASFDLIPGAWQIGFSGGGSFSAWNSANDHSVTVIGKWMMLGTLRFGSTTIDTRRQAGDVTYYSEGWAYQFPGIPGSFYTWNTTNINRYGRPERFGSTYEIRVVVEDGENLFRANAVIPLQTTHTLFGQPYTCYPTGTFGPYCYQSQTERTTVAGTITGPN